jgi:pentose-5-phosphate-3-epimerase
LAKRVGVAINRQPRRQGLEEILQDVEQVLIMTVNPGFGHQHFLSTTLPKIRRVRQMIKQMKLECDVEVDGGIDAETAPLAVTMGANVLVASLVRTKEWPQQWNGCEPPSRNCGKNLNESSDGTRQRSELCN